MYMQVIALTFSELNLSLLDSMPHYITSKI